MYFCTLQCLHLRSYTINTPLPKFLSVSNICTWIVLSSRNHFSECWTLPHLFADDNEAAPEVPESPSIPEEVISICSHRPAAAWWKCRNWGLLQYGQQYWAYEAFNHMDCMVLSPPQVFMICKLTSLFFFHAKSMELARSSSRDKVVADQSSAHRLAPSFAHSLVSE